MRSHVRALSAVVLLVVVAVACGPAAPTATSVPPADTPAAESTQVPVDTPAPSDTPVPPADTPEPVPTPLPTLSGSGGGVIAFVSHRDGNREIYLINADGSQERRLTNDPGDDDWLSWSPDGTQLAYTYRQTGRWQLHVMNADGSERRRLVTSSAVDGEPAWSPAGAEIAFCSDRSGDWGIYVVLADGSGLRRLTDSTSIDGLPAWSPDAARIAFVSERDGNQEIYVMAADGSDQRRLTDDDAADILPAWSPDGRRIAFTSERDGNQEIYVMDADGRNLQRLTDDPAQDWWPTWSPDSTRIAFASNRAGNSNIYVMNADGSAVQQLTTHPADDASPAWRPGLAAAPPEAGVLRITILYDNVAYDPQLKAAWGFAALIEFRGQTLLFDTGGDGATLLDNMEALGIDPAGIPTVVLSHIHGDHVDGLPGLLSAGAQPTIYVPPSFPASFRNQYSGRAEVLDVTAGQMVAEGMYSTGELQGPVGEQALVIDTEAGLVIVTGCAHPGVVRIVERSKELLPGRPVHLVLGGFHLGGKNPSQIQGILADFRRLEVERAAPAHCTGEQAIAAFAAEYGDDYVQAGVGRVIIIE